MLTEAGLSPNDGMSGISVDSSRSSSGKCNEQESESRIPRSPAVKASLPAVNRRLSQEQDQIHDGQRCHTAASASGASNSHGVKNSPSALGTVA